MKLLNIVPMEESCKLSAIARLAEEFGKKDVRAKICALSIASLCRNSENIDVVCNNDVYSATISVEDGVYDTKQTVKGNKNSFSFREESTMGTYDSYITLDLTSDNPYRAKMLIDERDDGISHTNKRYEIFYDENFEVSQVVASYYEGYNPELTIETIYSKESPTANSNEIIKQ